MVNRLITWVVSVPPDALEHVRTALEAIRKDPGIIGLLPDGGLSMVHFASVTLFDREAGEQPLLVFESNIDGSIRGYATKLVAVGRRGLDEIFQFDARYPKRTEPDANVIKYLVRTSKIPQLYHIGHPSVSVDGIRGDLELRRSIKAELEANPGLRAQSPADIVKYVRHEANCPSVFRSLVRPWLETWAGSPSNRPTPLREIRWRPDEIALRRLGRLLFLILIACTVKIALVILFGYHLLVPQREVILGAGVIIAGLVAMSSPDARVFRGILSAAFIAFLVELFLDLLALDPEKASTRVLVFAWAVAAPALLIAFSYVNIALHLKVTRPLPPLDAKLREELKTLLEAEDRSEHSIYNHVAGLTFLETPWRRLHWVRTLLALTFLNLFYRTYFVRGKLVSIPSIHFAQWSLLDDRRLFFVTNYDGSADSYLDDFFDALAKGVAFIWYKTKGFPNTTDPRRLKLWVRENQKLASVRYRAPVYQGLTVDLINNNALIRKRLLRGRGEGSARRWLRRLTTTPVEPTRLARFGHWLKELAGSAE